MIINILNFLKIHKMKNNNSLVIFNNKDNNYLMIKKILITKDNNYKMIGRGLEIYNKQIINLDNFLEKQRYKIN
jgi:hypothetical protein